MPPRYDQNTLTFRVRTIPPALDPVAIRAAELSARIRDRIAKRLAGRIHGLEVRVEGKAVILRGRCATYYSKQLAQHAALGVLEDETLTNAIVVGPGSAFPERG